MNDLWQGNNCENKLNGYYWTFIVLIHTVAILRLFLLRMNRERKRLVQWVLLDLLEIVPALQWAVVRVLQSYPLRLGSHIVNGFRIASQQHRKIKQFSLQDILFQLKLRNNYGTFQLLLRQKREVQNEVNKKSKILFKSFHFSSNQGFNSANSINLWLLSLDLPDPPESRSKLQHYLIKNDGV